MGVMEREIQDLKRFREIVRILSDEGFGFVLSKLQLRSRLPLVRHLGEPPEEIPAPERLRHTFERLGPTFIKFGQILAQRPDVVPREYIAELEKLEDDVPAFDPAVAKSIVEEELGPIDEVFDRFDEEPLAAASIAQVHRAKLTSGEEVIVKVRRPGIKEQMKKDLDILKFMAREGEKHVHKLKNMHAERAVNEFARWTTDELDLKKEARNARVMQRNLEDEEHVRIPDVHMDLTTEKVLVMEYAEGVKANDAEALDELDIDREQIARTAIRAGLKQTVRDGFFHADPHPSNFLISPEGDIIYLDFGMMGKLTLSTRRKLGLLLLHAANEEIDAAMDVVRDLGTIEEDADMDALKEDIEESILLIRNTTLEEQSIVQALFDISVQAAEHGVHMPSSLTILAKSMLTMEGIGLTIYPDFKIGEEYERTVESLLWKMNSPRKLARTFMIDVIQNRDLFARFPSQVSRVVEGLSQRGGTTNVDVDTGPDASTILVAALLLSSSLLLVQALPTETMLYVALLELVAAGLILLLK